MARRLCYIHIGPHKTGTSSIQWFLKRNRAELLKHGYFVPESGANRGAHHALVEKLSGLEVGEHREPLVARSIRALLETSCEAIVISSEALAGILGRRKHAVLFFSRIEELNLEPKLILFPRNHPQWINSSYASSVKGFRRWAPFQPYALGFVQSPGARFSRWIELANAHAAELIARPFTKETIVRGVIPEFLQSIGIKSSQFRDGEIRRNERVGPFTVSVARDLLGSIDEARKPLTWLQARRCKAKLAAYLEENGLADAGYYGLTTALARQIESELRPDNDTFAQRVWDRPWAEIFAGDTAAEFTPNDFEMRPPDFFTKRRLRRVIREMKAIVHEILQDPSLAAEARWNDLRQRSGGVSKV
jgi:hypothetical protein